MASRTGESGPDRLARTASRPLCWCRSTRSPTATAAEASIGIDFGGTKIEGISLAADGGEQARQRIPTPRDYGGSLRAVAGLVAILEREAGERGTVGIGIPGTGLVENANSTWLIGRPLRRDPEARLGRPVRLMNEANCFALSEAADGAGAGARVVFGVILGTGVGGGVVVEGRRLTGPACYCGRRGWVETWLSGPGLERDHHTVTGERLASRELAAAAGRSESAAVATLQRYHDCLGRALASVLNVLDPGVVVLGGGMTLGRASSRDPQPDSPG